MNYSKIAAVLAGSVMAAGVAAPAFAEDTTSPVSVGNMSTMPTSINGGVDQALNEQPVQKVVDATHVESSADALQGLAGSTPAGTTAQAVTGNAAQTVSGTVAQTVSGASAQTVTGNAAQALSGDAPQAVTGAVPQTVTGAVPGASLLGGLPFGGLPFGG